MTAMQRVMVPPPASRCRIHPKLPQPREPALRVEERGEAAQEQGEEAEGVHSGLVRGSGGRLRREHLRRQKGSEGVQLGVAVDETRGAKQRGGGDEGVGEGNAVRGLERGGFGAESVVGVVPAQGPGAHDREECGGGFRASLLRGDVVEFGEGDEGGVEPDFPGLGPAQDRFDFVSTGLIFGKGEDGGGVEEDGLIHDGAPVRAR